jgi:hypothetical protein
MNKVPFERGVMSSAITAETLCLERHGQEACENAAFPCALKRSSPDAQRDCPRNRDEWLVVSGQKLAWSLAPLKTLHSTTVCLTMLSVYSRKMACDIRGACIDIRGDVWRCRCGRCGSGRFGACLRQPALRATMNIGQALPARRHEGEAYAMALT